MASDPSKFFPGVLDHVGQEDAGVPAWRREAELADFCSNLQPFSDTVHLDVESQRR